MEKVAGGQGLQGNCLQTPGILMLAKRHDYCTKKCRQPEQG